jgi:hypothetical protein
MPKAICCSFVVEPFIECDTVTFKHVPMSEIQHQSRLIAERIARDIIPDAEKSPRQRPSPSQYLLNAVQQSSQLNIPPENVLEDGNVAGEYSPPDKSSRREQDVAFPLVHNIASDATVSQLCLAHRTGLVEVTIGVYGLPGDMTAMTPSMTLKEGGVLSIREKFSTGHGVCLTPPPPEIIPEASLQVRSRNFRVIM